MTLNDLQGHSPITSLFKCIFVQLCSTGALPLTRDLLAIAMFRVSSNMQLKRYQSCDGSYEN